MKKRVAALLIASVIMSMAAGCTGKKDTKNSSKKNKTGEDPVSEITLDVPTVKRENGKQAVFELSATGDKTMSEEELKKAYSEFIFGLMKECAQEANGENVLISSSVWLNEDKTENIYEDYLDYVQKHFDAGVSVLPFNQNGADMINSWVEAKTKDRIHDLINNLDGQGLMVLVNAITFDGTWKTGYEDYQVNTNVFTNGKGDRSTQMFLSSTESMYLSNSEAKGFLKEYDDGKYAFMTILPNDESIDINEFMADMTADEYWEFWESMDASADVYTMMPEFKTEYSVTLSNILQDMGMTDAFDADKADFSNMANSSPYISTVIHKTFIEVDRNGTKAAAATAVMVEDACMPEPEPVREVYCDRPYAYAIVDMETGLPVFLGTVENV